MKKCGAKEKSFSRLESIYRHTHINVFVHKESETKQHPILTYFTSLYFTFGERECEYTKYVFTALTLASIHSSLSFFN